MNVQITDTTPISGRSVHVSLDMPFQELLDINRQLSMIIESSKSPWDAVAKLSESLKLAMHEGIK